ncbi:hypothetical protein [Streptomyces rugosispiralis]|uniref:Uncharacterized protein n=1 Tax=Streptomyces rugosispiralis TaxID=2967341 RepID=A0ABT1UQC6_9ACTN|nr:hypothetical protein [Streptomyces rugosispiralis]MCQ8186780.1 hypothetical protein [Streptomyces rugosispiralis]
MGSSNMFYRGSGFWVRDSQAEVWLYLLAQEAKAVAAPAEWLVAAREDWELQATVGFVGFVSSRLDDHVGTHPDRVALTLELSERVLRRLLAWSPAIPKDVANSFGTGGPGSLFLQDPPTDSFLACGRAFISLLRGEFPPGFDRWAL